MSWVPNKSRVLGAFMVSAAFTAGLGAAPALAEPAIIVKSTVKEYPVGSKIDDEATITLENGDTVSVFTQKGSRTMRGPGTFVVGANPKSNRNRFANLKRKGAAQKSAAGATRGTFGSAESAIPSRPKVFFANVTRSGPLCLVDTNDVTLWRPFDDAAATYIVSGPGLEGPVPIAFEAGATVADTETSPVALTGGASYTITGGQAGSGPALTIATITVIELEEDYKRADLLAQALFENGCLDQFEVLSERLPGE